MPNLGDIIRELLGEYARLLQVRDSFIAACTVLWYDFALTFDREEHYFWSRKKWSWTDFLFFANRYIPLVITTMNVAGSVAPNPALGYYVTRPKSSCNFWIGYWETIGGAVQVFLVDLILVHRIYAIYQRDNRILILMLVLLFATTASSAGVIGAVIQSGHAIIPNIPGITVCYAESARSTILWALWVPDLTFEVVAFGFALYKTYQHIREMSDSPLQSLPVGTGAVGNEKTRSGKPLGQRLIERMFADSLLYFGCMFLLFVGNLISFKIGLSTGASNAGQEQILQGPTQSLMSLLGTHMLLHTREAVDTLFHPELGRAMEMGRPEASDMRFAPGVRPHTEDGNASSPSYDLGPDSSETRVLEASSRTENGMSSHSDGIAGVRQLENQIESRWRLGFDVKLKSRLTTAA